MRAGPLVAGSSGGVGAPAPSRRPVEQLEQRLVGRCRAAPSPARRARGSCRSAALRARGRATPAASAAGAGARSASPQRAATAAGTGTRRAPSMRASSAGSSTGSAATLNAPRASPTIASRYASPTSSRVHRLEAQPRHVGHEREQPRAQQPVRQERPGEESADPGRGLALEDQPGAQAHDAQLRVVALEAVEHPLRPRPCGGSRSWSGSRPSASSRRRAGPSGRASRRRPTRRRRAPARLPRPAARKTRARPVHVGLPDRLGVARGLDQPARGGRRSRRRGSAGRDRRETTFAAANSTFGSSSRRPPPRKAEHRLDSRLVDERLRAGSCRRCRSPRRRRRASGAHARARRRA